MSDSDNLLPSKQDLTDAVTDAVSGDSPASDTAAAATSAGDTLSIPAEPETSAAAPEPEPVTAPETPAPEAAAEPPAPEPAKADAAPAPEPEPAKAPEATPAPAPEPEPAKAPQATPAPAPEPEPAQPTEADAAPAASTAPEATPAPAPEPEPPAAPEATTAPAPEAATPAPAPEAEAAQAAATPAPAADTPAAAPTPAVADTPAATSAPAVADTPATPTPAVADTPAAAAPVVGQTVATPAAAAAMSAAAPPRPITDVPGDAVSLGPPTMGGFESGQIISGTALTVTKNEIEVDLGEGKVGVVGARHWTPALVVDLTGEVKVGDQVEAAVLMRADPKQRIVLSRTWARQKLAWDTVETADKQKTTIQARITDVVKGGLSLETSGLRAFLPASLVDVEPVADLEPLVGQTVDVRVIEADRTKARLIVSRKAALRAEQRSAAKAALGSIQVGHEATGKVVQITDFGAFVEVEGIRGLVHRSELGWNRNRHPSEVVKVGDEVNVKVVKVQASKNRLGLSMRVGADPLKTIKPGSRIDGTVTRLVDFGAFVRIHPEVEGLVHVSELAEYRVFQPEEVVMPGEQVTVKVLKIDKKRRTVDLSLRQAMVPDLDPPVADDADDEPAEEAAPAAEEASSDDKPAEAAPADDAVASDDKPADDAAASDDKPADDAAASDDKPADEEPADAGEDSAAEESE